MGEVEGGAQEEVSFGAQQSFGGGWDVISSVFLCPFVRCPRHPLSIDSPKLFVRRLSWHPIMCVLPGADRYPHTCRLWDRSPQIDLTHRASSSQKTTVHFEGRLWLVGDALRKTRRNSARK